MHRGARCLRYLRAHFSSRVIRKQSFCRELVLPVHRGVYC